jgi:hypothetical protein
MTRAVSRPVNASLPRNRARVGEGVQAPGAVRRNT